ncbi:hypothetical protein [Streptomyces sp. SID3343]|uniref:hypothetical protein n=1 Tax=Streptomyces sp. SID3343 TaxID=2690260 RepID=UPI00136DD7ED|nr:hypothetical protein [Streptomyces sp. SID3343]MYV97629.1 hypothetical protein [Streptomyces sp. SID3343]
MLTHAMGRIATTIVSATLIALALPLPAAQADTKDCGWQILCIEDGDGADDGDRPGSAGGSGQGNEGAVPACEFNGAEIPCELGASGLFDAALGCYRADVTPQPPPEDPRWWDGTAQRTAAEGAVYALNCLGGGPAIQRFLPIPLVQGLSAEELARRAMSKILLLPPVMHLTPGPGRETLVSLPVWLWTSPTPETWGPNSQTESDRGLSVTLTAKVDRIVWDMGDGSTRECTSPGAPYSAAAGASASPDCGYAYQRISARMPGGAYTVTATTHWTATWTSTTGRSGSFADITRSATVGDIRVGELQALNN